MRKLIANVVIFVRWTHRTNWRLTSPAKIIRLLTNYVLVWIRDYNQKRIPSFKEESEKSPFGLTQLGHEVSILPTSSAFSSKRRVVARVKVKLTPVSRIYRDPHSWFPWREAEAKEKAKLTTKRQEPLAFILCRRFYASYTIQPPAARDETMQKEEKDQCRLFTYVPGSENALESMANSPAPFWFNSKQSILCFGFHSWKRKGLCLSTRLKEYGDSTRNQAYKKKEGLEIGYRSGRGRLGT